ncbi:DNA-binding transcriptional regulator, LysR family [Andreprevotia lacus DSM 23236]|jgi:DNA-binding transcriptional LysR family regulator|uniref:DNA-binding transcriptional regulator, LysR family n=1 Tax=Andreprevotia lacus DSM 23236 TaxID=1121001 RepID=A0A1W1XEQ7_9NEIS|nr:LysR family transcriptional regulator [Andreprevotia lacus]SMC22347.1 DNA-binding transcriptional regulator, LysR family [Andreprevotia lacus DSM 23236]
MRLDQLDGLLAFVMVARKRSFTAAAAELQVSPPAVSQAVKSLEAKVGVRLLQRTTRSVNLTEAGERYLQRVAPAMADLELAAQELEEYRDQPAGLLRLTLPRIVGAMLLGSLATFRLAYPQVRLELSLDDCFVDIVADGFDAGIRLGEAVPRDMVAVPLTRNERTVLVATPEYLARKGTPASIAELANHDCVGYRFNNGNLYRWELLQDGKPVEIEINGPLVINDGNFLTEAALAGLGLVNTFERLVSAHLASGRLVSVLSQACPVWQGLYLYYPSRKQLPLKLRCLIDHWQARPELVMPNG